MTSDEASKLLAKSLAEIIKPDSKFGHTFLVTLNSFTYLGTLKILVVLVYKQNMCVCTQEKQNKTKETKKNKTKQNKNNTIRER